MFRPCGSDLVEFFKSPGWALIDEDDTRGSGMTMPGTPVLFSAANFGAWLMACYLVSTAGTMVAISCLTNFLQVGFSAH